MAFNPFDVAGLLDPFSLLARARREASVSEFMPLGIVNVLGHAECRSVLHDPVRFSSDPRFGGPALQIGLARSGGGATSGLIGTDAPDHSRLRGLLAPAFSVASIARLQVRVQRIADDLLDRVAAAGSMDLIADFAQPLPLIVIAEILGVPLEQQDAFRQWSDELATAIDTERVRQALAHLTAFFADQSSSEERQSGNDLIGHLLRAELRDKSLTRDELMAQCILLLVAGNQTTRNLIGNTALALLQSPGSMSKLHRADASLQEAIEESARYFPPVQCAVRYATTDTMLADRRIVAGQPVFVWISSANRDELVFDRPDCFDVSRKPRAHLSFGLGPHFCLGAHLGRLETRVALSSLLRRWPHMRLVGDQPLQALPSIMAFGIRRMEVAEV